MTRSLLALGLALLAGVGCTGQSAHAQTAPLSAAAPTAPDAGSVPSLHAHCTDSPCPAGQTCMSYYGFAGARGPHFKTCEIPCPQGKGCPEGLRCATIADGPGQVCTAR